MLQQGGQQGQGSLSPRCAGRVAPLPEGYSHGPLQLLVLDGAIQRLQREESGISRAVVPGQGSCSGDGEGTPGQPRGTGG